jgi:uncharacterized membrane protein YgaE (UPF0421/DUF939 family)
MPLNPSTQETEARGSQGHYGLCSEFKARLSYTARPSFKTKRKRERERQTDRHTHTHTHTHILTERERERDQAQNINKEMLHVQTPKLPAPFLAILFLRLQKITNEFTK